VKPARIAIFGILGAGTFVLLHVFMVATWRTLFAVAPWPGYEGAARAGIVSPWFINSPRSLWLARATIFSVAFLLAALRRSPPWRVALVFWLGVAIAVAAMYATTALPDLPNGWIGYLVYPFRTLLPVLVATVAGDVVRRFLGRSRVSVDG
jgi:hypothetical protein